MRVVKAILPSKPKRDGSEVFKECVALNTAFVESTLSYEARRRARAEEREERAKGHSEGSSTITVQKGLVWLGVCSVAAIGLSKLVLSLLAN